MYIREVSQTSRSKNWWKAVNYRDRRKGSNQTTYPGVWEHHPGYFVWQVQVNGKRYREGGYRSGEEAAMARQAFIEWHDLPHTKPFTDEHYRYLVDTYGHPRPRSGESG